MSSRSSSFSDNGSDDNNGRQYFSPEEMRSVIEELTETQNSTFQPKQNKVGKLTKETQVGNLDGKLSEEEQSKLSEPQLFAYKMEHGLLTEAEQLKLSISDLLRYNMQHRRHGIEGPSKPTTTTTKIVPQKLDRNAIETSFRNIYNPQTEVTQQQPPQTEVIKRNAHPSKVAQRITDVEETILPRTTSKRDGIRVIDEPWTTSITTCAETVPHVSTLFSFAKKNPPLSLKGVYQCIKKTSLFPDNYKIRENKLKQFLNYNSTAVTTTTTNTIYVDVAMIQNWQTAILLYLPHVKGEKLVIKFFGEQHIVYTEKTFTDLQKHMDLLVLLIQQLEKSCFYRMIGSKNSVGVVALGINKKNILTNMLKKYVEIDVPFDKHVTKMMVNFSHKYEDIAPTKHVVNICDDLIQIDQSLGEREIPSSETWDEIYPTDFSSSESPLQEIKTGMVVSHAFMKKHFHTFITLRRDNANIDAEQVLDLKVSHKNGESSIIESMNRSLEPGFEPELYKKIKEPLDISSITYFWRRVSHLLGGTKRRRRTTSDSPYTTKSARRTRRTAR